MINIIPTPKKIREKSGTLSLDNVSVYLGDGADYRVKRLASLLCGEISSKLGYTVPLTCAKPSGKSIVVCHNDSKECEEYSISVTEDSVLIRSEGAKGVFYGIQSLRQMVNEFGTSLPCVEITDEPDFSYRGFYQDVTRGRVNKLEKLKSIADMLAYYKVNSLQLYIEDAFLFKEFEGIITEDEAMTPDEILELDRYCYDNFIELVPSLSTFGHLFTLLQSDRYSYLCELENHKMKTHYWMEKQWHHTADPYNPDTIKVIGSMIEQYIPLFRSDKFNICCDETMDLCNGRNEGKDRGEAYFFHLNKLIEILEAHGKHPMIWGDVCMAHPDLMKERVTADITVLNWCYRKEVPEWLGRFFEERGYPSIICPGTSSWNKFVEDIDESTGNISSFAYLGKKNHALGILNTNWGDFGHICSFNCNLYGLVLGAQKSWNVDAETECDFKKAASRLLYGVSDFDITELIGRLGNAERSASWGKLVTWYSKNFIEGEKTEFTYGEESNLTDCDTVSNIKTCGEFCEILSSLEGEREKLGDLMIAAEAIALMNRTVLYIRGIEGYTDGEALRGDIAVWLEEYKRSWLRHDKPSQLWRVCEFIGQISSCMER